VGTEQFAAAPAVARQRLICARGRRLPFSSSLAELLLRRDEAARRAVVSQSSSGASVTAGASGSGR
jgi:hypothetical protein